MTGASTTVELELTPRWPAQARCDSVLPAAATDRHHFRAAGSAEVLVAPDGVATRAEDDDDEPVDEIANEPAPKRRPARPAPLG